MNLFKDTNGAVSIFLVIILVPCILVSGLFVEAGRVFMSKGNAEAAADLALNSLLTNYDKELNDWYGLIASCQNIDEFYGETAELFLEIVGVDNVTPSVANSFATAMGNDSIHNLLQVTNETSGIKIVEEVDGTSLAEPHIIKNQIVEFMKFRGPLEIYESFLDRLKENEDELGLEEAVKAEENEELVNKKIDYYTAEAEFLEEAYNVYINLYHYSQYQWDNKILEQWYTNMETYHKKYDEIGNYVIKNLYNTEGLGKYTRLKLLLSDYEKKYVPEKEEYFKKVYSAKEGDEYYVTSNKMEELLKELNGDITTFNNYKSDFEQSVSEYVKVMPGTVDGTAYPVQWWYQVNNAIVSGGGNSKDARLRVAAEDLMTSYAKVIAMEEFCTVKDELPDDWDSGVAKAKKSAENIYNNYLKSDSGAAGGTYLKVTKELESVSTKYADQISVNSEKVQEYNTFLKGTSSTLGTDMENMEKAIEYLGNAKNAANKLPELADAYQETLTAWTGEANRLVSEDNSNMMAQADKEEIAAIKEGDKLFDPSKVTREGVVELETRVTNVKGQISTTLEELEKLKFGTKHMKDISNIDTLKSTMKNKVHNKDIPWKSTELSEFAKNIVSEYLKPEKLKAFKELNTGTEYDIKIDYESYENHLPDILVYMINTLDYTVEDDIEETRVKLKDILKLKKESTNQEMAEDTFQAPSVNLIDYSGDNGYKLGASIARIPSNLLALIKEDGLTDMRDDIYTAAYIMSMFSDRTIQYKDNPKTLTNVDINAGNNKAYGAEVEYILYGGTCEEAINGAYSDIYSIRFALNTISGFANFWKTGQDGKGTAIAIEAIANSLSAMTSGVIPAPIIKVALILILVALETNIDVQSLVKGNAIPLYKKKADDWTLELSGSIAVGNGVNLTEIVDDIKGGAEGKEADDSDSGLYYSDYIILFILMGLGNDTLANDMYKRIGEVIQVNMSNDMGKAYGFFKLQASLRVSPFMITLPMYNDSTISGDGMIDWNTYDVAVTRGY